MRIVLSSGWLEAHVEMDLVAVSDEDWAFLAKLREMIRARLADAEPTPQEPAS